MSRFSDEGKGLWAGVADVTVLGGSATWLANRAWAVFQRPPGAAQRQATHEHLQHTMDRVLYALYMSASNLHFIGAANLARAPGDLLPHILLP